MAKPAHQPDSVQQQSLKILVREGEGEVITLLPDIL